MNHSKFVKAALAGAILSLTAGGAYAHSILGGSLPTNAANVDLFRTTCYKADGVTALKDSSGNAWTLPMATATPNTTDNTAQVVYGVAKTDSNSGSVTATIALSNSGNVSCDPNGSGNLGNDCASNPGANANNILPAASGTITVSSKSTSTHVTEWESLAGTGAYTAYTADDEPPTNVTGVAVTGWATTHFAPIGPDGVTANGEYLIMLSHTGSNTHTYDFIMHCINSNTSGTADAAHTGQGSMFQNQGDGTIAPSGDYDMVLDNGAGN